MIYGIAFQSYMLIEMLEIQMNKNVAQPILYTHPYITEIFYWINFHPCIKVAIGSM